MAEFRNMSEPEKNQGINYFKELDILRAMADELIYTLYGQKPISKNDRKKIISKILDEAQKDKPELKSKIEELKIKGILDLNMESY